MNNCFIPVKIKNGDKMVNLKNKLKGILAAISIFSLIYIPLDHNAEPISYYYEPEIKTNNTSTTNREYTVKEFNGKIAVFENSNTTPLYILDSPFTRDLPKADRELLQNGIKATTEEELNKILEDYDN